MKPENYDGYFARAKSYFEMGNYVEALKDTQMALDRCNSKTTSLDIINVLVRLRDDITRKQNVCLTTSKIQVHAPPSSHISSSTSSRMSQHDDDDDGGAEEGDISTDL